MTTATYALAVDFNNNGSYADANEDISTYLQTFTLDRGRSVPIALPGVGSVQAAQLTAQLKNTDKRFSPYYSAGPLFGNIVPGRPVRLQATSGTTRTLFRGVLGDIRPKKDMAGDVNMASLVAYGLLSRLTAPEVSPAASAGAATGTLMQSVLDGVGIAAADYSLETGQTTTSRWYLRKKKALEALHELEATEGPPALVFEAAGGPITYHDRYHRIVTTRSNTSQVTLSDNAGASGTVRYRMPQPAERLAGIYNEVTAQVPQFTVGALAVLWTLAETGVTIMSGETKEWLATWPSDSAGNLIGDGYVDAWTTPVADTDWTCTGAAATDLTLTTSYAANDLPFKGANQMRIRLTNGGATQAIMTLLQARGTPVTRQNPSAGNYRDNASRDLYGLRSYALGPWLASLDYAALFGAFVLGIYKDPITAFSAITFCANTNATHMAAALDQEIGDRVTVVCDAFGISQDFWIEGVRHELGRDHVHWVTWRLSPWVPGAPGSSTSYGTWDVSSWDSTAAWAF